MTLFRRQLFENKNEKSLKQFEEIFKKFMSNSETDLNSVMAIKIVFVQHLDRLEDLVGVAQQLSHVKHHDLSNIFDTNQFIIAILQSAFQFRQQKALQDYFIQTEDCFSNSWTGNLTLT